MMGSMMLTVVSVNTGRWVLASVISRVIVVVVDSDGVP